MHDEMRFPQLGQDRPFHSLNGTSFDLKVKSEVQDLISSS